MGQAERTAGLPETQRGRFNCDGSFCLYEFERNRTPEQFERLIGHVRAGNISVPFQSLVLLPGASEQTQLAAIALGSVAVRLGRWIRLERCVRLGRWARLERLV